MTHRKLIVHPDGTDEIFNLVFFEGHDTADIEKEIRHLYGMLEPWDDTGLIAMPVSDWPASICEHITELQNADPMAVLILPAEDPRWEPIEHIFDRWKGEDQSRQTEEVGEDDVDLAHFEDYAEECPGSYSLNITGSWALVNCKDCLRRKDNG